MAATKHKQAAAKSKAKLRHEEVHFEDMVVKDLEQTIKTSDVWKTNVRVIARTPDGNIDISKICDSLTWVDVSSDDLKNVNTQAALTGSLTLRKPALRQYNKLLPPALSSRVVNGVDRFGAMGVVIIAQVGYGKHYVNIWAMRVVPGYNNDVAESITLADGTWSLTLADDLWQIAQNVADFKYAAGKKTHKKGWTCDEIAQDVCRRYRIPISALAQGTAQFSLTHAQTHMTSPIHVITEAYLEETKRTGRTFITRWGAPTKKHPFGALEVVPMRRNRNLMKFREQLLDATLTTSQVHGFATIVEAHGTIKEGKKSKAKKITYTATSKDGVKRFGWVRKTLNVSGTLSSELELQIIAKRALAQRLTPIRTAELNHPGIATIRRGDAIHIDIPEEGYKNVTVNALATPKGNHPKLLTKALQAAEKRDPTVFALPDPDTIKPVTAGGDNGPDYLPVANQGIAFVTSATHSVSAGSYTMDLQCSFIDVLDPAEMRAQVDKTIRDWKNRGKTKKTKRDGSNSSQPSGKTRNPAPGASWNRLDMGFDGAYGSQGAHAPYDGVIKGIGISGWPGTGRYFVVLNDDQSGADYTRAMYFAEGATPIYGNGTHVTAGQKIGNVASGGFEIGPANTSNYDALAKTYGLGSSGAHAMVMRFYSFMQGLGAGTSTDTASAGNA